MAELSPAYAARRRTPVRSPKPELQEQQRHDVIAQGFAPMLWPTRRSRVDALHDERIRHAGAVTNHSPASRPSISQFATADVVFEWVECRQTTWCCWICLKVMCCQRCSGPRARRYPMEGVVVSTVTLFQWRPGRARSAPPNQLAANELASQRTCSLSGREKEREDCSGRTPSLAFPLLLTLRGSPSWPSQAAAPPSLSTTEPIHRTAAARGREEQHSEWLGVDTTGTTWSEITCGIRRAPTPPGPGG